jgi:hypothetical protein
MRIVAVVGDLVQMTGDGRTGRILGGRVIERSGGAMCDLTVHVEMRSACFFIEPQNQCQTICEWFGLKITRTVFHLFGPQNRWRRFVSGLASKLLGRFSPLWPQNRW